MIPSLKLVNVEYRYIFIVRFVVYWMELLKLSPTRLRITRSIENFSTLSNKMRWCTFD